MIKRISVLLVVALGLAFAFASSVSAQITSYTSGFQVANQSSTQASIVITYYNQDGSVNATVNETIPGNGSLTFFPIDASAGFNGSVVISSDQPIVAISNLLGNGGAAGASFESFSAGAATNNLPIIMKGNFGFDTWFSTQNTGTDAADVTVSYSGQASCNETATIQAGAAATFNQATNTCLPSGYVGAATVTVTDTANDSIATTVVQQNATQLLAYNGFTTGATEPVMPLVQGENFGFVTGIQIQNTGNTSTSVTVSYVAGSAGSNCTETTSIAAGASETFALSSSCTGIGGATFVGAASVTNNSNNQPLAAIVNQTNLGDSGSAYNAIDSASATGTVSFPLIMQANFGFFTGFNVIIRQA
ncbi:MAG: hypothetical protein AAF490_16785 [Chloroflexota bacterium]